jgi:hypothetical protein
MNDMTSLVAEIRRELHDVEQEIRGHPYLADLEAGGVRCEELSRFAGAQYHIIRSDLRSVALLVNRFGASAGGSFFQAVLGGETAALEAVKAFAKAVGWTRSDWRPTSPRREPRPIRPCVVGAVWL